MRPLKLWTVLIPMLLFVSVDAIDDDYDDVAIDFTINPSNYTSHNTTKNDQYLVLAMRLNCSMLVLRHKGIKVEKARSDSIFKPIQRVAPTLSTPKETHSTIEPQPKTTSPPLPSNEFTIPPSIFDGHGDIPFSVEIPIENFDSISLPDLNQPDLNSTEFYQQLLNLKPEYDRKPRTLTTGLDLPHRTIIKRQLGSAIGDGLPQRNFTTGNDRPKLTLTGRLNQRRLILTQQMRELTSKHEQPQQNVTTGSTQPKLEWTSILNPLQWPGYAQQFLNSKTRHGQPERNLTTEHDKQQQILTIARDQQQRNLTTAHDQQQRNLTSGHGGKHRNLTAGHDQQQQRNLTTGHDQQQRNLTTAHDQQQRTSTTAHDQQQRNSLTIRHDQQQNLTTAHDQQQRNLTAGHDQQQRNLTTASQQTNHRDSRRNESPAVANNVITSESSKFDAHHRVNDSKTKETEMPECAYALDDDGSSIRWYEVIAQNGGVPGEVNATRLTPNKTKVLEPCHRPITNTMPPLGDLLYDYKLIEYEKVYRRERAFRRFSGTPSEFVDIIGQMIWAPPKVEHRYFYFWYRQDDTGFYVYVRKRHRCIFERSPLTVNCRLVRDFAACENYLLVRSLTPGLQAALIG